MAVSAGLGMAGLGLALGNAQAAPGPVPLYHWCPGDFWDRDGATTGSGAAATTTSTAIWMAGITVATGGPTGDPVGSSGATGVATTGGPEATAATTAVSRGGRGVNPGNLAGIEAYLRNR
jgi:hypothetical protein